jgi:group I intron endonuclease
MPIDNNMTLTYITMKMYYIYTLYNIITGKIYVGQTHDLNERWAKHKSNAKAFYRRNVCNKYLYRDIMVYGINNFSFAIMYKNLNKSNADLLEVYWIKYFNAIDRECGYNLTKGGSGSEGTKHSEETKLKISIIKNKLSLDDANKIRYLYINSDKNYIDLSNEFNVSITTISGILNNKLYRIDPNCIEIDKIKNKKRNNKITGSKRKISFDDVEKIKYLYLNKIHSMKQLSNIYNVSPTTICNIINNITYNIR